MNKCTLCCTPSVIKWYRFFVACFFACFFDAPTIFYRKKCPPPSSLKSLATPLPRRHKLHCIFNKNNVKVSYSCTENMESIIKKHSRKVINAKPTPNTDKTCNCRKKDQCPLQNKCLSTNLVYITPMSKQTTTRKKWTTLDWQKEHSNNDRTSITTPFDTENTPTASSSLNTYGSYKCKWWKQRVQRQMINHHLGKSLRQRLQTVQLCLTKKYCIIKTDKPNLLNKISELISKCRHENKFYIKNYKNEVT